MEQYKEKAWAKLNLSLDVLGRREDGYHDLAMVMMSTELCDDVTVALRGDREICVDCGVPWLPRDERNLAVRAANAFFSAVEEPTLGADIRIIKRLPVGAGMAGGSSDAAAVLRALNRLTGVNLPLPELQKIGLMVGSDVPYCIVGGTALARGRGELLTQLPALPECHILICKPRFSISTADLFGKIDGKPLRTHPDTAGLVRALEQGDLPGVARRMYNVFEDVLPRNCSEIFSVRSGILSAGALGAIMTGTGSAVFGLFDDEEKAKAAYALFSAQYKDCFLTCAASRTGAEKTTG